MKMHRKGQNKIPALQSPSADIAEEIISERVLQTF